MRITCREATEFIVKREEGKLTFKQRVQLWLHMGICGLCKLFAKQSKFISKMSSHLEGHLEESLTIEEKTQMIESLQKQ